MEQTPRKKAAKPYPPEFRERVVRVRWNTAMSTARAEEAFCARLNTLDMVAWPLNKPPFGKAWAIHPRLHRQHGAKGHHMLGRFLELWIVQGTRH